MISKVSICNSAFSKIGVEPITSLSEDSKEGRLANRQYEVIKESLLYDHYWNFAIKRKALAKEATTALGGGSKFTLPSDCLRPIRLLNNQYYKLEGRSIVTKSGAAELLYVSKSVPESSFTPKFAEALAWKLATEFAVTMVQSVSMFDRIENKAERYIIDAASADAQEDYLDTIHDNTFLQAHFAESDYPANYEEY